MAGERILLIDDEPAVQRAIRLSLAGYGFHVDVAVTGTEGWIRALKAPRPQVVLLDLGLPDLDGLEVCTRIRAAATVPIIVLTARDAEHEKIAALDGGADDYVTKPFAMGELLARIRVALRHVLDGPVGLQPQRFGDMLLDPVAHQVLVRKVPVHLTPTEFKLLVALVANAGRVSTHRYLLREVWGTGYAGDSQLLRVFIGQVRNKIEDNPGEPEYILTEPGVGYRFRAAEG